MKKIITLVGTSIFKEFDISDLKVKFLEYSKYESEIKEAKSEINELDDINCCAEVASILKFKEGNNLNNEDIKVYLLASDTIASVLAAEKIKKVLENKGVKVEFEKEYGKGVIKNLRVDNLENFEDGIDNLIKRVIEIASDGESVEKKHFDDVVFNITGGYKGVVAYLAILGEIVGSEVIYMFENSNELLLLPKLPLNFDSEIADLYLPYLTDRNIRFASKEIKDKLQEMRFIYENNKLTRLGEFALKMLSDRKTEFGRIMELMILYKYTKQENYAKVDLSYEYEIGSEKGEIDLILENEEEKVFVEVKSVNSFKLKQSQKHIRFIENLDSNSKNKVFKIIFYLIDERLFEQRKRNFKELKKMCKEKKIDFRVKYIKIEPQKLNELLKKADDLEIKEFQID